VYLMRNLLWVDGTAGAIAGVLVLLLGGWLSRLHGLPVELLQLIGVVNLGYGSYSLALASRARRPFAAIVLLVAANAIWAVICLQWAVTYAGSATLFGMGHLVGEGIFVGGLAALEWRLREQLRAR
jgi:hypothetical protein